jgi:hypothetical protein
MYWQMLLATVAATFLVAVDAGIFGKGLKFFSFADQTFSTETGTKIQGKLICLSALSESDTL